MDDKLTMVAMPVNIHMMCGKRHFGKDWVHIDKANFPHINSNDIFLEKYPTKSVDLIYCSHGIAYFSKKELHSLLRYWFNALKSGGVLQLATPDWQALRQLEQPLLGPLYGEMDCNGKYIYHKMIYTFESIKLVLESVGFNDIHLYDHRKTEHPNTGIWSDRFDDHSAAYVDDRLISLNVECNA